MIIIFKSVVRGHALRIRCVDYIGHRGDNRHGYRTFVERSEYRIAVDGKLVDCATTLEHAYRRAAKASALIDPPRFLGASIDHLLDRAENCAETGI